jgi:hypothetical protein
VRSSSSKATGTISTSWSASWIHPFQPLNKFLGNDQHEPRMAGCGYVSLHCPKCKNIHCYLPHVAGREWTNSHKNTPRRSLGRCFSFSQARRRPAWFLARQRKDLGQPRSPPLRALPIGMLSLQSAEYRGLDLLLNAAIAGMRVKGAHRLTR